MAAPARPPPQTTTPPVLTEDHRPHQLRQDSVSPVSQAAPDPLPPSMPQRRPAAGNRWCGAGQRAGTLPIVLSDRCRATRWAARQIPGRTGEDQLALTDRRPPRPSPTPGAHRPRRPAATLPQGRRWRPSGKSAVQHLLLAPSTSSPRTGPWDQPGSGCRHTRARAVFDTTTDQRWRRPGRAGQKRVGRLLRCGQARVTGGHRGGSRSERRTEAEKQSDCPVTSVLAAPSPPRTSQLRTKLRRTAQAKRGCGSEVPGDGSNGLRRAGQTAFPHSPPGSGSHAADGPGPGRLPVPPAHPRSAAPQPEPGIYPAVIFRPWARPSQAL